MEEESPTNERADDRADVGKSGVSLAPAANIAEGNGNGAEESEDNGPGVSEPQGEEEHYRLLDNHDGSTSGRDFEQFFQTGRLELVRGVVARIAGFLPQLPGTPGEQRTAAGFAQEDDFKDDKSAVQSHLNPLDGAPAEVVAGINVAGVQGRSCGAQYSDEREQGDGKANFVGRPDGRERTGDDGDACSAEDAEEEAAHNDGGDIVAGEERNEPNDEPGVADQVDGLSADKLRHGAEDRRDLPEEECTSSQLHVR